MYCTEYMALRKAYVDDLDKGSKQDLILKCVWYYILGQFDTKDGKPHSIEKPCPLLGDSGDCSAYDARPLKCRTYGLIPPEMHQRIVDQVSKESGVPKDLIPLSVQCPYVKISEEDKDRFPNGTIPEEVIAEIEAQIKKNDNSIGISKGIQKMEMGFLAFHDWHMMCELGEDWMSKITPVRQHVSLEWKKNFMTDLRSAMSGSSS